MKGILVLGLIAALAVAPGGSLKCPQCSSFDFSCDTHDVSECPPDANTSCIISTAGWPPASPPTSFQDMACSAIDCSLFPTPLGFYVRVADGETAWFKSKCWNAAPCSCTSCFPPEYPTEGTGDTQCPGCIGVNDTSCDESYVRCNPDERCIDGLAEVVQGTTVLFTLRVKGCSNITEDLFQFLSIPNTKIGNIVFQQLSCRDAVPIPKNLSSGGAPAAAP